MEKAVCARGRIHHSVAGRDILLALVSGSSHSSSKASRVHSRLISILIVHALKQLYVLGVLLCTLQIGVSGILES